MTSVII